MRTLLALLIGCSCMAQAQDMHFDHLTSDEGLPQNTVRALLEDRQGFVWLGTNSGLCRYDGISFRYFKADKQRSGKGPLTSGVLSLAEDSSGNIWMGDSRNGGLNRYDPVSDRWICFPRDSAGRKGPVEGYVYKILVTREGAVWIASRWSLQEVVPQKDGRYLFTNYPLETGGYQKPFLVIYDMVEGEDGSIWLATTYGLVQFDVKKRSMVYASGQVSDGKVWVVRCLERDPLGRLWLGQGQGGISVLERNKWIPGKHFPGLSAYPAEMLNQTVQDLLFVKNNKLVIGTTGGLMLYDLSAETFRHYRNQEGQKYSLINNLVYSLASDRAGNLWVGTDRGLSVDLESKPALYTINSESLPGPPSFNDRVLRILVDKEGMVWTGGEGLIQRTDRKTGKVTNIHVGNQATLIGGLAEDEKGNVWAAAAPWLLRIRKSDLSIERIPIRYLHTLDEKNVMTILPDRDGKLWLGSVSQVLCYDPQTRRWSGVTVDYLTYFMGLALDDQGSLYAADIFYLFEVDRVGMVLKGINKDGNGLWNRREYLSGTKSLAYTKGALYIAQKESVLAYSIGTKAWKEWDAGTGLPGETVRSLVADFQGNLWMSGDRGIARIDTGGMVKRFGDRSSLPCMEFNSRANAIDREGNLYFGCDRGLVYFHPGTFRLNNYKPPVYFTGFELYNKQVSVGDTNTGLSLKQTVNYLQEINLDHRHQVFTVEFAALNYLHPEANTYRHRLVGFEDQWVDDGQRRRVTYTNLPPGNYRLEVMAANNDGVWSDKIASLQITVSPPWYATWWARFCYILSGLIAVSLLVRQRIARERRRAQLAAAELRVRIAEAEKKALEVTTAAKVEKARLDEREIMRKKSAQDFHDEAGIKLTRIGLLTKVAKQRVRDEELSVFLTRIEENTQDLSAGMRDFIWVLDPSQDTLEAVLRRLQDFGNKIFEYSNMTFSTDGISDRLARYILGFEQKRHLMLVFKEAMNNALKHSLAKHVTLSVSEEDGQVVISLSDDGKGITNAVQQDSYGLRNMEYRSSRIGASFLLRSLPGAGVSVSVVLEKTSFQLAEA